MNLLKLSLLMILLGGAGGVFGSLVGGSLGRGWALGGGLLVGAALVVAAGYLGSRWGWIRPSQRSWAILGGVFGFALAAMVTLSTLSSPIAPMLSTVLIGTGAVLGAVVGRSPHLKT